MSEFYGTNDILYCPGFVWCLHADPGDGVKRLQQRLYERFQSEGRQVVVAEEAAPRSMRKRLFQEPAIVDWLVQNSSLSQASAEQTIGDFPVRVAPLLSQNAANPRRFLGMAAALSNDPEVLLYDTMGMDLVGMQRLHAYVRVRYAGCLVFVTPRTDLQTEFCPSQLCPTQGQCLRVQL